MSKSVKRLHEQFKPEHYNLKIELNKAKMTFSGTVVIEGIKTGRPSSRLTFHQKELTVTSVSVTQHDKDGPTSIPVERINTQKTYDEVRVHTAKPLRGGKYTVSLDFKGKITRPMNGIYPCFYEKDGVQRVILATQFESHHAREAFPCIDEPEAKATFDLCLTTEEGETVIADTPILSQDTVDKKLVTQFETTPKMSTYLLAFVVGELDYKEKTTTGGTLVRTYATPANAGFTDFALDMAVKCLEFYNEYFGIPYPLEKCDLIALPDFASGAMENWGCITFREQCMLVDPKNTSIPTKQYVAMVVAHELAHQWFGNLVTMRWWTDLWLNEGFASWIEYLAVDHVFPEWDMWTQFVTDEQQAAFKLDALEHTHAIEAPVHHPDEIRTIFDTISYSKGSSVIHMLHEYLGPLPFRDGLRHYLKEHAYGNTDTVDLWNALEAVSKKPVASFMEAWTSQPGFPVLHVDSTGKDIQLTQEPFKLNRSNIKKPSELLWPIPLLAGNKELPDTLTKKTGNFSVAQATDLKLNQSQSGFFRTVYSSEHLAELGKQIAKGELNPLDRLGILSDTFEATKAGYMGTLDALTLLSNYSDEDSSVVWDIIAGNLGELRMVMSTDELRDILKPYVRKLVAKQLKRLGWDPIKDEPYLDSLLRITILSLAASADEPAIVEKLLDSFKQLVNPDDINPDIRGIVYGTVARLGDEKDFDKLLKLHNTSTSSEDRITIAAALTGFEQPELIDRALSLVTTDDVRLQDAPYWIAYSFMNRHARQTTWEWMKKNWPWLEKNLGTDLSFYRFPIYAARGFSDEVFIKDYMAFFKKVSMPALERSISQGKEMVEWHAAWKKRDFNAIFKFFLDQSKL